jgi:hypothetical protein
MGMKHPKPGSIWMLRGTIHVVDHTNPRTLVVCTVTEDGHQRAYLLDYWQEAARLATEQEIGGKAL